MQDNNSMLEQQEAPLADRIVASTVAGMQRHGHKPSDQAIESYRATAEFIQAMADGNAPPVLAVATGPTGSGKTEEVAAAVRELLRDPAYRDVGILVVVSTLRQIKPLIARMELTDDQFAVKVGTDPENDELNAKGLVGLMPTKKAADDAHHARLHWNRESVDRLFRLDHASRLEQIEAAFRALGKFIDVRIKELA